MIHDLSAFQPGMPFPPNDTGERDRMDRYGVNVRLYRNDHDHADVYGVSRRTLRPELQVAHMMILGYHERLTTHWHDLVFGEDPVPLVDSEPATGDVVEFVQASGLIDAAREVIIDVSSLGDGLFKVTKGADGVKIVSQQPEHWWPIVSVNDIRDVQAHVLAWEFQVEQPARTFFSREQVEKFVQLEIHTPGRVDKVVYTLDRDVLGEDVTDRFIPEAEQVVQLGTDELLLVHVPNKRTSRDYYGTDDYARIDTLVMEMEDRLAQMSRILDKHADPTVYGPLSALTMNQDTGTWEFKTQGYLAMNDKDDPVPGYLEWNGELQAALSQFNLLFSHMLMLSETSPAGFGMFGEVPPVESGIALKRLLRTDLAKAARLKTAFGHAFSQVLSIASEVSDSGFSVPESFSWMFRDGLPDDPDENSQIAERSIREGFMSRYNAIQFLQPTWTQGQVQAELARVEEHDELLHARAIELALASKGILPESEASDLVEVGATEEPEAEAQPEAPVGGVEPEAE